MLIETGSLHGGLDCHGTAIVWVCTFYIRKRLLGKVWFTGNLTLLMLVYDTYG